MSNIKIKNEPYFEYDEENGVTTCILSDGKDVYLGFAHCHEEDMDMKSEKTGCQIALWRAEIKYYAHLRDHEIKPALKALKQVYYTMKHSSKFNPKSYENKMLWRQIHSKEFDLDVVNHMIDSRRQDLVSYLKDKDLFYKRIRANRQKGQK